MKLLGDFVEERFAREAAAEIERVMRALVKRADAKSIIFDLRIDVTTSGQTYPQVFRCSHGKTETDHEEMP